jgi:hypothetical protein
MSTVAIARVGRLALLLVAVGLLLQLLATFYWTPATFILSAVVGVGLVVAGASTFAWAVWQARRSPDPGRSS